MTLGDNIKQCRHDKKLTQQNLAELANIDRSLIAKIEKGITKDPSVFTVYKIAIALEVSIESLMV